MSPQVEPVVQSSKLETNDRQNELLNACARYKFVLASGPRKSSKTIGCEIAICIHAWNVERANVTIVTISQTVGSDSGVWKQLTEEILPAYMALGQGMKWVDQPYQNSNKKWTCSVTNKFGKVSTIQLDSLKEESKVEERFKSREYTMIYVPELSNFRERKTFDTWVMSLRGYNVPKEVFLFLADTNPSDEGEQSWIYKLFYLDRVRTYEEYVEALKDEDENRTPQSREAYLTFQKKLCLVEFTIPDNWYLSQEEVDEIISMYDYSQDLTDRYVYGKWVEAAQDALFGEVFRPAKHVVGQIETSGVPNPGILLPEDDCWELIIGWDPGSSRNSAAVFIEKWMPFDPATKKHLAPIFKVIDEVVIVGEDHTIDRFTEKVVERMDWWNERWERVFKWRHWADRSVFDQKEIRQNLLPSQLINIASGGRIILQAADRGPGTVQLRVDLLRRLMFSGRIYFSNDLAPRTIQMCKSIKKGQTEHQAIQKGTKHKHPFDAMMYAIAEETCDETEIRLMQALMNHGKEQNAPSGLVAVAA